MKKSKGKKFFSVVAIILIAAFSLIFLSRTICFIKAKINYTHNTEVWDSLNFDGIINDQTDFENLNYGFGTVAKNGCGVVSIYNILKLENRPANLPDLIQKFDMNGENVFGLGGTRPSKMIRVLRELEFDVTYTTNKSKFETISQNCKYSIFVYFGIQNFVPFGHYQLLYNFDGEKYKTINITGEYTFKEITEIPHTFLEMMIGVDA